MSAQVETKRAKRQAAGPYGKVGQILNELDDRLGVAKGGRTFLDKIFPDHWSFMLGEIALYSFVVLLVTGIFLTLYYVPSSAITTYHGSYLPLVGQKMSEAYASSVNLSFAVRGGLLMRQMHHWACDIFVGSIVVHMGRVFFTGAFRKPRELNWTIGTTLLVLAIAEGFLGYSLPDDLVSGTGIRIAYSIILSLPVVGTYIAFFLFAKTTGFLFVVGGVIALLGAFAQINPIWQFGFYDAARISYAVQPDFYMGFLDGALRIWPAWEFSAFGHTIPLEVTLPSVVLPGILFTLVYAWPAIERKFTGDNELHNLLDRPINRPKRTAAGVSVAAFLSVLFIASSTDVIANFFKVSLNTVLWDMRILVIVVPLIAYPVTYKICRELQGFEGAGKRKTTNVVTRTADGEYVAVPAPVYVDDAHHELDALPIPTFVVDERAEEVSTGVRRAER